MRKLAFILVFLSLTCCSVSTFPGNPTIPDTVVVANPEQNVVSIRTISSLELGVTTHVDTIRLLGTPYSDVQSSTDRVLLYETEMETGLIRFTELRFVNGILVSIITGF